MICYLIPTLLDFQILVRKFLPFATVLSLAIFVLSLGLRWTKINQLTPPRTSAPLTSIKSPSLSYFLQQSPRTLYQRKQNILIITFCFKKQTRKHKWRLEFSSSFLERACWLGHQKRGWTPGARSCWRGWKYNKNSAGKIKRIRWRQLMLAPFYWLEFKSNISSCSIELVKSP